MVMASDKRFDLFRVTVGILGRSEDGESVAAGRAANVTPPVPVVILLHDETTVSGLAQNRGDGGLLVPAPAHHVATLQHCCIITTGSFSPTTSSSNSECDSEYADTAGPLIGSTSADACSGRARHPRGRPESGAVHCGGLDRGRRSAQLGALPEARRSGARGQAAATRGRGGRGRERPVELGIWRSRSGNKQCRKPSSENKSRSPPCG